MPNCTRKLEFDSAHRVMRHESKCRHLHGHRYVAEITVQADELDDLGRVIDFSVIKKIVGGWIDENWDHGTIVNEFDMSLIRVCREEDWKFYTMKGNPTAENIAQYLYKKAGSLLKDKGIEILMVRIYETPNCWSDYREDQQ